LTRRKIIGIIDSGVGGLSVLETMYRLSLAEEIVYIADPFYFPYGEKSKEELLPIVRPLLRFLVEVGKADVIVTACGTVSSLCLPDLRSEFPLPILGILEPACREAVKVTVRKKIVVLATRATIRSGSFREALQIADDSVEVYEEAWPEFIEAVEQGNFDTPRWRQWVGEQLRFFAEQGIDTAIMGCTHFALISRFFEELAPAGFVIVNPACACAQEVQALFPDYPLSPCGDQRLRIFVRGDLTHFQQVLSTLPLVLGDFELSLFPSALALGSEARCV